MWQNSTFFLIFEKVWKVFLITRKRSSWDRRWGISRFPWEKNCQRVLGTWKKLSVTGHYSRASSETFEKLIYNSWVSQFINCGANIAVVKNKKSAFLEIFEKKIRYNSWISRIVNKKKKKNKQTKTKTKEGERVRDENSFQELLMFFSLPYFGKVLLIGHGNWQWVGGRWMAGLPTATKRSSSFLSKGRISCGLRLLMGTRLWECCRKCPTISSLPLPHLSAVFRLRCFFPRGWVKWEEGISSQFTLDQLEIIGGRRAVLIVPLKMPPKISVYHTEFPKNLNIWKPVRIFSPPISLIW